MNSSDKVTITAAVIGLVGVLGSALVSNWDKIFPRNASQPTVQQGPPPTNVGAGGGGGGDPKPIGGKSPEPAPKVVAAADGHPLCTVSLASPESGAVLTEQRLDDRRVEDVWDFGWRPCQGASRYQLRVVAPGTAGSVFDIDTITSTRYQYRRIASGLSLPSGFAWAVRAFVDGHWQGWSETWTFGVVTPAAPPQVQQVCVPTPAIPAPNAVLTQRRIEARQVELVWNFGWRSCPGASQYHLYVIGANALNPLVNVDTLTSATYQFRRTGGGIMAANLKGWTWMVRAYIDGKWGEWSEKRTFDVAPQAAPQERR